jgi:hypothetical protein
MGGLNFRKSLAILIRSGYHLYRRSGIGCSAATGLCRVGTLFPANDLQGQAGRFAPMAEKTKNKLGKTAVRHDVSDYVKTLSEEYRMLVVLKAQLYGGNWEPMLDDLRNRLAGKPYIFKLANRIHDDIERIEQMQKFEHDHNIDLADYVEMQ